MIPRTWTLTVLLLAAAIGTAPAARSLAQPASGAGTSSNESSAQRSNVSDPEAQIATIQAELAAAVQRKEERSESVSKLKDQLLQLRTTTTPPDESYSFSALEELRDELSLEQSRSETIDTTVATASEAVEDAKTSLDRKERKRRQAKEAATANTDEQAASELSAAVALAELESKLAGEVLKLAKTNLEVETLNREYHDLQLKLLKEKIARTFEHVELTTEDRQRQLDVIRKQEVSLLRARDATQANLTYHQDTWFKARQRLEDAESPDPALVEQVEAHHLGFQTEQQRLSVLNQRLTRIKKLREVWARRFQIFSGSIDDVSQLGDWRSESRDYLEQIDRESRNQLSRLADVRRQIAALGTRLLAAGDTAPELTRWLTAQQQHLQKLARTLQRDLDSLDATRRLFEKLQTDIGGRLSEATARERLAGAWQQVVRLWNYELMSFDDRPITPSKIVTSFVLLIIGIWLSRWLSSLFGNRFLRRIGIHSSGAAAIQSVAFYLLLCLFVLLSLHIANVPLTAFTILGGAVALGVGFGSQNIINNFISGLILLAERPVRVGDMIEVDGLFATVDKIGARSTRVTTGSNLEIIVPNSKFLENNVVNWTLSDDRQRTRVVVGVIYGSPVDKVVELLQQASEEHPNVLPYPESVVLFTDFGDNSLVFELHFWIRVRSYFERLRIESEMRHRIWKLFGDMDIVIAFPQRDVHLDTTGPVEVRMIAE